MREDRERRSGVAGRVLTVRVALLLVALLLAAAAAGAWVSQLGGKPAARPVAVRQRLGAAVVATPAGPTPAAPASPAAATPTAAGSLGTATPAEASAALDAAPAEPALVEVEPEVVGNGEAMVVSVAAPGAAFAMLRYRDETVPLVPEDDLFWGVVGVPVGAGPGPALLSIETRTTSGRLIDVIERSYEVIAVERPVDQLQLPAAVMTALLAPESVEEEARLRAQQFSTYDHVPRWDAPFRVPARGVITTQFGSARSINGGPVGASHTGTDLANALGTPVLAAAPGRVIWVGEMPIRGRSIIIDHGAGVLSGYHHLDAEEVAAGDAVEAGQVIGAIGSTGLATGPHLHWEITVWGINVDPLPWTERLYRP